MIMNKSHSLPITLICFVFNILIFPGTGTTGAQTMVSQDKYLPFPFVVFPVENYPPAFFADSLTAGRASGLALFNLDQYYVYGFSTDHDSVVSHLCREKSFAAFEHYFIPGNFSHQKKKLPPYARLFKKEFYRIRRLLPRMILFCPENAHNETPRTQRMIKFLADSVSKPRVSLFEGGQDLYDEIYFRFRETIYKEWHAAQFIIAKRVVYNFLNEKLIYKKSIYRMGLPPEIRLTSIQYPNYIPDIQLQVDPRYAKQIILRWDRIYRKLNIFIDRKQLQRARDEVLENIFLNSQSPQHRITLALKSALFCGDLLNMETFLQQLEKMDLTDLERRIKNLLEWQQFDIYWITTQSVDNELINEIKDFTGMKIVDQTE